MITDGTTNVLALFNIVADSVEIAIEDPNNTAWESGTEWEAGTEWATVDYPDFSTVFGAEDFSDSASLWLEFNTLDSAARVTITFEIDDVNAKTIAAGVLSMGEVFATSKPVNRPLTEGLKDYSIVKELSNGATYVKKRDIVRTLSGSLFVGQQEEFYDVMNIARINGKNPIAWQIVDSEDYRWVIYARFEAMPSGTHTYPCNSDINFTLIEVL